MSIQYKRSPAEFCVEQDGEASKDGGILHKDHLRLFPEEQENSQQSLVRVFKKGGEFPLFFCQGNVFDRDIEPLGKKLAPVRALRSAPDQEQSFLKGEIQVRSSLLAGERLFGSCSGFNHLPNILIP
jgi:hypothetical protein